MHVGGRAVSIFLSFDRTAALKKKQLPGTETKDKAHHSPGVLEVILAILQIKIT